MCEDRFDMPRSATFPYLERVTQQLQHDEKPLTGPLVRGDKETIAAHLKCLEDEPFQEVYAAFVKSFESLNPKDAPDAKH